MISSRKIYLFNMLNALLPNRACPSLKCRMLRWAGARVGEGVEIFQGMKVQGIGELEIGARAFLGHEVLLLLNEGSKIVIGEEAVVSSRSMIVTGFHPVDPAGPRIIARTGTASTIAIERGAAVLAGCQILPGVTVGEMAMVAAGATVTHDVEPWTLVGGCPAHLIKHLK